LRISRTICDIASIEGAMNGAVDLVHFVEGILAVIEPHVMTILATLCSHRPA
jgi:hypothetical protein